MKTNQGWVVIAVVIGTGGFGLWWQYESQRQMQRELGELRRQNGERAQLIEANRRLAKTQPTAEEWEELHADHAAIPRLRTEIADLQARAQTATEQVAAHSSERFAAGDKVQMGDWKNAGAATSRAALETILWAAAGGDIDGLSNRLLLSDERSRQLAVKLLESVPAAIREQYDTPERLIAFLASKDVPLGAAQVIASIPLNAPVPTEQVRVQLSTPAGNTRDLILQFANHGDGWKLLVPGMAAMKYAAMLKGTEAGSTITLTAKVITVAPSKTTGAPK